MSAGGGGGGGDVSNSESVMLLELVTVSKFYIDSANF